MELKGRNALVTGGAVRLGRALVLALARSGVNVAIHYHASVKEMETLRSEWENGRKNNQCVVTEEDVASVVGSWTGIPVSKLTQSESEKLLHMGTRCTTA